MTVDAPDDLFRFGVLEVDARSGEVRKGGSRIKLREQPFRVLVALLEHPGELVTREELQARIWPNDSFGDFDHAVNVAGTGSPVRSDFFGFRLKAAQRWRPHKCRARR